MLPARERNEESNGGVWPLPIPPMCEVPAQPVTGCVTWGTPLALSEPHYLLYRMTRLDQAVPLPALRLGRRAR